MAEEKEKKEEVEKKKGSSLKFIIVGIVVVVLAVAGFVAWQLLGSSGGYTEGAGEISDMSELAVAEDEEQQYTLDTFVVNLNDPGAKRYLKINIVLGYVSETLSAELDRRLPQLRDLILLQLSSKGLEDIQTPDGKIALQRELTQRINQVLTGGKVRNVYFTEFVIQ